ncbi:MAG: type 11 methyltransferase [Parcubacteria group bacterium Gr01-1014_70]|nr:MAG: type 11 methyltransferase [Parcubacteria group bacterium Gr01-1014_70]
MFNAEAKIYDKFYAKKNYEGEIAEILPLLRGKTILDVGCGTGRHAAVLQQKGYEVFGVEPCEEMAVRARERGIAVSGTYPVGRVFENAVLLFDVINFFPDPVSELKRIHAALEQGGRLVFDAWDSTEETKLLSYTFRNGIARVAHKKKRGSRVDVRFFFFPPFVYSHHVLFVHTADELRRLAESAGFRFTQHEGKWWVFEK